MPGQTNVSGESGVPGMGLRDAVFGNTQRRVARIGQGTWRMEQSAADSAVAALRRGLDLGLTHIDTAEMYGSGAAETLIGRAIEGRREM